MLSVKQRVESADYLRGILALMVMMYHFCNWGAEIKLNPFIKDTLYKFGTFGVQQFFVISGFSLALAYGGEQFRQVRDVFGFLLKRFFRIAPLFTLANVLTVLGGRAPNATFSKILANCFLLFPFAYGNNGSIPTGGWSIGVESFFYLITPILCGLFKWRRLSSWFVFISFTFFLAIFFTVPCENPSQLFVLSFSVAILAVLFILVLDTNMDKIAKFVLGYLGKISFALYLIHPIVSVRLLNHDGMFLFLVSVSAVAIFFSWVVTQYFDIPVQQRLRGVLVGKSKLYIGSGV